MRKVNKISLLAMVLGLLMNGCATIPSKTYEETVSGWTSYKDVEKWMSENFVYDQSRLAELKRNNSRSRKNVYSPQMVFKLKGGVCYDGAKFVKETLNRINPAYEAKVVWLDNSDVAHFVCSFKIDGKLYIMDYSTLHRDMIGIFGPFNSLEEYRIFYGSRHPGNRFASYVTIK
jgi:transglutaminase superfamily protein